MAFAFFPIHLLRQITCWLFLILPMVSLAENLFAEETIYALQFDGKDGVRIPNLNFHNRKRLTLEGFVTPTALPQPGQAWSVIGGQVLDVRLVNRKNKISWEYQIQMAGTGIQRILSDEEVVPNQRVHLAIVWDGKRVFGYLNGKQQGESVEALELKQGKENTLFIGCAQLRANFFRGSIDELRYAEWVVYDEPFTPPETPLKRVRNTIGLYHIDEAQGRYIEDSSGNNRRGEIKGAHWKTIKP